MICFIYVSFNVIFILAYYGEALWAELSVELQLDILKDE